LYTEITKKEPPKYVDYVFNIINKLICLIIQIFNMNPSIVVGLTGSLVCFFTVYIFPLTLHFKSLYGENKSDVVSSERLI